MIESSLGAVGDPKRVFRGHGVSARRRCNLVRWEAEEVSRGQFVASRNTRRGGWPMGHSRLGVRLLVSTRRGGRSAGASRGQGACGTLPCLVRWEAMWDLSRPGLGVRSVGRSHGAVGGRGGFLRPGVRRAQGWVRWEDSVSLSRPGTKEDS